MAIDNTIVTARLQDINEGLVRQSGGLVEAHFRKSKRFGVAARICNLIRGYDVVKDFNVLAAAGGELGISADTLDAGLRELEEVGYVRIYRSGGDIAKIEESIPLLNDRFEAIGQKWIDSHPSEIELAALGMLDDLMIAPHRARELCKRRGIDRQTFDIVRDVGQTGEFLKTYTSPADGAVIVYSPLYHDENPEKVIELIDRFPDEDVIGNLRTIRAYQGTPVDTISDPVLLAAIQTGCVPTPTVTSSKGAKRFMFTPLQGVGKLEKALLEEGASNCCLCSIWSALLRCQQNPFPAAHSRTAKRPEGDRTALRDRAAVCASAKAGDRKNYTCAWLSVSLQLSFARYRGEPASTRDGHSIPGRPGSGQRQSERS